MGTISAFAHGHRKTKKNLCRGGRSQDLPDPALYDRKTHKGPIQITLYTKRPTDTVTEQHTNVLYK